MTLKARVHDGRLLLDEPTELPEGTEIALLPLDPADRAALHRALVTQERDIVLSPEAQTEIWQVWAEHGPQGPIEDDGEPEIP